VSDISAFKTIFDTIYKPLEPGSAAEAFERERARFANLPFDLEEINRVRAFRAWKIANKRLMDMRDGITAVPMFEIDPPASLDTHRKLQALKAKR
jgi:hypothetical protein